MNSPPKISRKTSLHINKRPKLQDIILNKNKALNNKLENKNKLTNNINVAANISCQKNKKLFHLRLIRL